MARLRHAVRILLLDERDRVLLFRGEDPHDGVVFWFPAGGGVEDGEDVHAAAAREIREETGLSAVELGPEIWRRRHVFTWHGTEWDQRERWFVARVAHFTPDLSGMSADERSEIRECRWWTTQELDATGQDLVPRDLPTGLRALLTDGPPRAPTHIGL